MSKKASCADEVYYDVAMSRYAQQFEQVDALDRKFGNILALSNGILAVFVSMVALRGDDLKPCSLALLGLGGLAYLVAMYFGLRAYMTKPFSMRPDLDTLKGHCEGFDNPAMRMWVGDESIASVKDNEGRITNKVESGKLALAFLSVEAVLLAAGVISSLV